MVLKWSGLLVGCWLIVSQSVWALPKPIVEAKKTTPPKAAEKVVPRQELEGIPKQIATLAQSRWEALIDGRLETAYNFLSPATRKAKSFSQFRRETHGVGMWKSIVVKTVQCTPKEKPQRCEVSIDLTMEVRHHRIKDPISITRPISDVWLYDDEQKKWWFVKK